MVGKPEVIARIGSAEITSGLPVIRPGSMPSAEIASYNRLTVSNPH
jgi:hypothetical protein